MGQNDIIGRIELNPSFVLSGDNTNNTHIYSSIFAFLLPLLAIMAIN